MATRHSLKELSKRDNGMCWLCFETVKAEDASRDHVIAQAQDGVWSSENLALAHKSCNSRRGFDTWEMYQLTQTGQYGKSQAHLDHADKILKRAYGFAEQFAQDEVEELIRYSSKVGRRILNGEREFLAKQKKARKAAANA